MSRAIVLAALLVAACSSKQPDPAPAPAPPPETAPAAAPPPAPAPAVPAPKAPVAAVTDTVPADFPQECRDYAALIDKVKGCDKLGGARDGLQQGYISVRQSWPSLSAQQRAAFGPQCKTQADSIRNAAAATCSW